MMSKKILQLILLFCVIVCVCLHTLISVHGQSQQQISQSIRVVATVKTLGLSDSIYGEQAVLSSQSNARQQKTAFRQLVEIKTVRPLVLTDFSRSASQSNNTTHDSLPNLVGKRLLIHAKQPLINVDTLTNSHLSVDFQKLTELQPTQTMQVILNISPLVVDTSSFYYRWLASRHVDGEANIVAFNPRFGNAHGVDATKNGLLQDRLHMLRWELRDYFYRGFSAKRDWRGLSTEKQQSLAVTLSLLTGDRGLISQETKQLYQLGGISHLLAISGTHVLFLAIVLSAFIIQVANRCFPRLYQCVPRQQVQWIVMVIAATLYALFTGFDVPAARTVFMLIAVGVSRHFFIGYSSRQVLLIVAVIMAINDPFVLWQAGYWLSFIAVMLLISFNQKTNQPTNQVYQQPSHLAWIVTFLKKVYPFIVLQLWMFIALLPISLLFFGKVSAWGLVVNLFAIGIYGWIIVPLNLLAGLLYGVYEPLASLLWQITDGLVFNVHKFLRYTLHADNNMSMVADVWLYTKVNAGFMVICLLIALPWLLPKKSFAKVLSVPPMVLLFFILINQQSGTGYYTRLDKVNGDGSEVKITLLTYARLANNDQQGYNQHYHSSILVANGSSRWLVVNADDVSTNSFNTNKNTDNHRINASHDEDDTLAKTWIESLKKLGVSSLTGIIIQSPNMSLYNASQSVKKVMPVGYMWLAGKQTLQPNEDRVLPCTRGRAWHSATRQSAFSISALTGWQDISNPVQWQCALHIQAENIIIDSVYNTYGVIAEELVFFNANNRDNNLNYNAKNSVNIPVKNVILNVGHAVPKKSLQTTQNPWQLWLLLCQDKQMIPAISGNDSLWLSFSHNLPIINHIGHALNDTQSIEEYQVVNKGGFDLTSEKSTIKDRNTSNVITLDTHNKSNTIILQSRLLDYNVDDGLYGIEGIDK